VASEGRAVVELLGRRPGRGRFVSELAAALRRTHPGADLEGILAELEAAGTVIVRDHHCADPHLEGVDLRIAALVVDRGDGVDAQARAVAEIEATWERWLGEYLATHRCT
jgi:hypothetical protein